ncbi:hypothetical protein L1887_27659 [Cichorium endivia]|nr:hypothetical protein L1887_27659 [Cichorium endivia]
MLIGCCLQWWRFGTNFALADFTSAVWLLPASWSSDFLIILSLPLVVLLCLGGLSLQFGPDASPLMTGAALCFFYPAGWLGMRDGEQHASHSSSPSQQWTLI